MNNNHKLFVFILFSLAFILLLIWYPKSKSNTRNHYIENMTNKNQTTCCDNNPLLLAMKNSTDISILKEQVNDLVKLKEQVRVLEDETKNNSKYLNTLQQDDADVAKSIQSQMEDDDS